MRKFLVLTTCLWALGQIATAQTPAPQEASATAPAKTVTATTGDTIKIQITTPAPGTSATVNIVVGITGATAASPAPAASTLVAQPAPQPAPMPSLPVPAGWTAPSGVPVPAFGLSEVAPVPSPWTTEIAGFYYVDQKAPGASDSRKYGLPGAPRQTIPTTLPAGAIVELHGVYDYAPQGYSSIVGAGTAASPIYIRGHDAATRPTIKRELHVLASYVILENLAFADNDGTLCGLPVILAPAHHVAFRSCDVSGNKNSGGLALETYATGVTLHDILIYRCTIHDNGDWRANFDQDRHGIHVGKFASNIWILDNELTRNSGDGIQINAGSKTDQAGTHHIYVARNNSYQNKQSGMWTKQANDVIFSQNRIWNHRPSGSSPGQGTGFQYAPDRVWFIGNDVSDCDIGIYLGSDSGLGTGTQAYLLDNRLHGLHTAGTFRAGSGWANAGIEAQGGVYVWIAGNTIDDADAGITSANRAATFYISSNVITRIAPGQAMFLEGPPQIVTTGELRTAARAQFKTLYGFDLK